MVEKIPKWCAGKVEVSSLEFDILLSFETN